MSRTARLVSTFISGAFRQSCCRALEIVGPGVERPRPGQGDIDKHGARCDRRQRVGRRTAGNARLAVELPVAGAVAVAMLGEVDVDVILVEAVGAGAEHRGEAGAGRRLHGEPEFLGDGGVGRMHGHAVLELERADVERVGVPVLGDLGAGDAVAAAALVGIEVLDHGEVRSENGGASREIVAHPVHDRLRGLAAQHRGRRNLDRLAVLADDALERDDIGAAAAMRTVHVAHRPEHRAVGREAELACARRRFGLVDRRGGGVVGPGWS